MIDSDDFDFRYEIGVSQPVNTLKLSDKERLIVDLMAKHFTILIVKAELDQMFKCGLSSTLNILELVRENKGMRQLFVYDQQPPMSWDDLYNILPAVMSPEGSNRREEEEAVMMKWIKLSQAIEGVYDESHNVILDHHYNFFSRF